MKIKKYIILLFIFVCFIVNATGCHNSSDNTTYEAGEQTNEFKITKQINTITKKAYKVGCVKDEETAKNIADAIFKSFYGEGYDNDLPLLVDFNKKNQTWQVKSQIPKNAVGGSFYIIIKKRNAEIVGIWMYQ